MTPSVYAFVKRLKDEGRLEGSVLDVGSYDVNGCVRDLFEKSKYTGWDKRPGPNVSEVHDIYHMFFSKPREYDNVLCLEMLEHVREPSEAVEILKYHLRDGGNLVLTTRGIGYGLHDEPEDFYRFTVHAMRYLLSGMGNVEVISAENGMGIYGIGTKRSNE